MIPDLQTRETGTAELMDGNGCDAARLLNTYRDFDRVNALLSGWRGLYVRHIRPVLQSVGSGATVLDIGCGGGDVLRRLAAWAARDGLSPCFVGADPDARAVAFAKSHAPAPGVSYVCATADDLADAGERFTVVLSNHLLHHLTDAEVAGLCVTSAHLATRLVIHADIHRHPFAYATFPLIGGAFRESFILQDGLLSIRRAYTPGELRRVVPPGYHVRIAFPFRLQAWWRP